MENGKYSRLFLKVRREKNQWNQASTHEKQHTRQNFNSPIYLFVFNTIYLRIYIKIVCVPFCLSHVLVFLFSLVFFFWIVIVCSLHYCVWERWTWVCVCISISFCYCFFFFFRLCLASRVLFTPRFTNRSFNSRASFANDDDDDDGNNNNNNGKQHN